MTQHNYKHEIFGKLVLDPYLVSEKSRNNAKSPKTLRFIAVLFRQRIGKWSR
jgi:hypothetical protein